MQAFAGKLGWRHGVLVFDHTNLADAATEFNRYNRVKLVVADADTARRTIMGTFRATNIEDFTNLARDVLGLHVQDRPGEIVISR
jgi:transmembrane sensor